VASDTSAAEIVSDVGVEIASDLDWIDMIAGWLSDGPAWHRARVVLKRVISIVKHRFA